MASGHDALQPPKALAFPGDNRDSVFSTATTSAAPSFKAHESASLMGAAVPELPDLQGETKKNKRHPLLYALVGLAALAVIAVAVVVPVYFKVIKHSNSSTASANSGSGSPSGSPGGGSTPPTTVVTSGGDGSTVTRDDGSTFTYTNKLGGFWVFDPTNPYNDSAQAQSYTPPLNQPWKYGLDRIFGVNLGGWLVLEPFISPALYEPYQPTNPNYSGPQAVDEWTLCQAIAANKSSGGVAQVIENHYATFITEDDFAQIAAAGLNWVRLPVPYWMVEKFDDEPFLEGVAWKYFLKAIEWARKYGIRINLDLHSIPGSQNGYNHSGKLGLINWLQGTMGIANAQRSLNTIRTITEFISQPQYTDVVPMFSVINEPAATTIGVPAMTSYYLQVHDMMRNITGLGKGPFISIHNGFRPFADWVDFMPGSDRIAIDQHPYFCFFGMQATPIAAQKNRPCQEWVNQYNSTMTTFGFAMAGEWSLSHNDCAYYLNGANGGYRYDGTFEGSDRIGSCEPWLDADGWTDATKADLKTFAMGQMDATGNWFFWTWKIAPSDRTGKVNAPLWSYSLGVKGGWLPTDPRESIGQCGNPHPLPGPLAATHTAYASQTIAPAFRAQNPFPPAEIPGIDNVAALPQYTPTGTPHTLAPPVFPSATATAGSGWIGPNNGWTGDYVPKEGCDYPNQWDAVNAPVPAQCNGHRRVVRGGPRETGVPTR